MVRPHSTKITKVPPRDLWKHCITYFYQHNYGNVRDDVIKAILICSYSMEWMRVCMALFWSSNSEWGESFCDAMPTQLTWLQEWGVARQGRRQAHLVMSTEWERPIAFIPFYMMVQFVPIFQNAARFAEWSKTSPGKSRNSSLRG